MRIGKLKTLIRRYREAKANGQLQHASEATMRTWIDELLSLFGWDVQNTHQVLTEHSLNKNERNRLHEIGSSNTRPDYTLVNGRVKLAFIDAKSLSVDIENDKNAAFQIRSYGWSIGAPFSVVTNFEQLAIYDCSVMPNVEDATSYARLYLLRYDQYEEMSETLEAILARGNVINGNTRLVHGKGNALDEKFSVMLGEVRKDLARAILLHNQIDSTRTLSYYVQTIINRILFIRVCESRELEVEGLLLQFSQQGFWDAFKTCSYADFYEHYDGPMFRKIPPLQTLTIDNDVFERFLRHLYYPSPYRFDVIPLKTLSDIYDLFLGYELVVNASNVTDTLRSEFKKSNGVVTTPTHIVNQVIGCTIPETALKNIPTSDILNLKIVDIACGSGAFLVGVFDHLTKELENRIDRGEEIAPGFVVQVGNRSLMTLEGRRAVINHCLYGVDINPEAVEVAKMSLSLKLIDSYLQSDFEAAGLLGSQILQGIGANIKCGNSLVGEDIQTMYPSILKDVAQLQATNAFDWHASFPDVFEKGGFDYVVGNPPYVEVKNYNVALPYMAAYVKGFYASAKNGKTDLAMPFIEQGVRLLNEHGRLGYIVQKRFFKADYGKGVRKLLTSEHLLNGIYDYEETNLFANRITYVAILVCDRRTEMNTHVWYSNSAKNGHRLFPVNTFTGTPWNFGNAELSALRLRLSESLGTLGEVCNVKVGVQVLWNDAYQIKVDRIANGKIYGHSVIDDDVIVEEAACRPLLCNEHFSPLTKRRYTTYAIFPYSVTDEGEVTELSISNLAIQYPLACAYLEKHKSLILENVETLPEKNGAYTLTEHWHLFTRANNHGAVYKKLCVPMTAQYPQASVVLDEHIYCDNANMFFVQLHDINETHLYALAAIINSTIFSMFARSIANPQQGGYYKFNKQFLDPVPVPKDEFLRGSRRIARLANIAQCIEQTNEQLHNTVDGQTSGLENALRCLWAELDHLCDSLYGLTKEDRALIYQTPRNDRDPHGQEN
ncbi:MAG: N-6 DNA methylase [Bacteroidaceae bacterium]|nr:N-6 DNA methylase [Bacteroidaceae bacterium]